MVGLVWIWKLICQLELTKGANMMKRTDWEIESDWRNECGTDGFYMELISYIISWRWQSVTCFTPRKCKRCRDNLDNKKESYWYWTSRPHHVKNHVFFQIRGEWGKNNVSLLAPSSFVDSKGVVTLLAFRIVWLYWRRINLYKADTPRLNCISAAIDNTFFYQIHDEFPGDRKSVV